MGMIAPNELPFDVGEEVGTVTAAEQIYPGAYHLQTNQGNGTQLHEYYAVTESSPIFAKIKNYGQRFSDLRLYPLHEDASGWRIINYEIGKDLVKKGISIGGAETLYSVAQNAALYHPEYFGMFPVPIYTPRGITLRHKTLGNGVYWLETDQAEVMLAVCYPIWNKEFSPMARVIGDVTAYDRKQGINKMRGYMFFAEQTLCVAVFELMETRPQWEGTLVDKPALMNAIWKNIPKYALIKNGQAPETKERLDILDTEYRIKPMSETTEKQIIGMYPDKGTDFLKLLE